MALTTGMIHGIFMMVGFGWLLPSGVLSAHFLKGGNHWYKAHVVFQVLGLIVGTIGFIIAAVNFDVFASGHRKQGFVHGCVGVTVFSLALLQPLNAVLRPQRAEPDHATDEFTRQEAQKQQRRRLAWEWFHKGTGYLVLILALTNIILGAMMEGPIWVAGYLGAGLGSLALLGVTLWCRSRTLKQEDDQTSNESGADPDLPNVS